MSRGLNPPKSAKTRFKFSAGLNLETFDTIFKWNQPYLSRGLNLNRRSNSLNSAIGLINEPDKLGLLKKSLVIIYFSTSPPSPLLPSLSLKIIYRLSKTKSGFMFSLFWFK